MKVYEDSEGQFTFDDMNAELPEIQIRGGIEGLQASNYKAFDDDQQTVFDNEFLLQDRIQKIQQIVSQYGEENFYVSFSGGKDSTVLSALVDMAIPFNKIPRVFANTGIELNMIRDFVLELAKRDERVVIIKPSVSIKEMLEKEGYPFKSKAHSLYLYKYQKKGLEYKSVRAYIEMERKKNGEKIQTACPKKLKYQFSPEFKLKISDHCCLRMKEEPLINWSKEHNKPYSIVGIMREEGGRRTKAQCLAFIDKKLKRFQPMVVLDSEWEEWFISKYNVKICDIYYPPYNFIRTGCKGCPFALNLQKELDALEEFFPNEKKQCELIWKPVYDEYRRIGYRLKKANDNPNQLSLDLAQGNTEDG